VSTEEKAKDYKDLGHPPGHDVTPQLQVIARLLAQLDR